MKRNYYRLYIGGNKETAHSYKDVKTYEEMVIWNWAYAKSLKQPEVVYCFLEGWESNKRLFDMEVPENIKDEVVKAVRLLDDDPLSFEEYREFSADCECGSLIGSGNGYYCEYCGQEFDDHFEPIDI